jgi:probable rRNA maturation factor
MIEREAVATPGEAPRTMILLDPDLDPHRSRRISAQAAASRIPSTRTLIRFLREAQPAVRLRGQVTVLLTTDRRIRQLNRDFRGKDKATDVLSFPAEPIQNAKPAERVAGDLAISVPTARKQSAACGHSLGTEIRVLMLHGLLHLAGYDHETDDGLMARREQLLRARLGLPAGLIERTHRKSPPRTRRTAASRSGEGGAR